MAMVRPMMVMRDDRPDRMLMQRQGQGLHSRPGCPPFYPVGPFNRPPNVFDGEEEDYGRSIPPPRLGWDGHQQQQGLGGVMFRGRMNMHQHSAPRLLQPIPGQQEWEGPRPPLPDVLRMGPPVGVVSRQTPGLDSEFHANFRQGDELGDMRNAESIKGIHRPRHDDIIENNYYLNASRASHREMLERSNHHLKNVYSTSQDNISTDDHLKRVPRGPYGNFVDHDSCRPDVSRPFQRMPLAVDIPARSHTSAHNTWTGNNPSDLIMLYGSANLPRLSQDVTADASVPPGFQSIILPCKRPRDEDAEFDESRSQRLRSVDRLPPEVDGFCFRSAPVDDEIEEGQLTPPPESLSVYRPEPIGPPGFCKPDRDRSQAPATRDAIIVPNSRGFPPETQLVGSAIHQQDMRPPQPTDPTSSRQPGFREAGAESARRLVVRTDWSCTGNYSRSSIGKGSEAVSPVRRSHSTAKLSGAESPLRKHKAARDAGAEVVTAVRPANGKSGVCDHGLLTSFKRVSTDGRSEIKHRNREIGSLYDEGIDLHKGLRNGEGHSSRGADVITSTISDVSSRRRAGIEAEIRNRQVDARAIEKVYDREYSRRPHLDESSHQEARSLTSRKSKHSSDFDHRSSRSTRWDDAYRKSRNDRDSKALSVKRSTSKVSGAGRETTSFHKRVERTAVVDNRSTAGRSRIYNEANEREVIKDGQESPRKKRERLSDKRKKDTEHGLSFAGSERALAVQSGKEGRNLRSYSEVAGQALPPYTKRETGRSRGSEGYDIGQRPPFGSKLGTRKEDSVPTVTETFGQEKLAYQTNNKSVETSPGNLKGSQVSNESVLGKFLFHSRLERKDVPSFKQSYKTSDVDNKNKTISLSKIPGRTMKKFDTVREELNSQLHARLLKLQIPDELRGEEAVEISQPSICISPGVINNTCTGYERTAEALLRNSTDSTHAGCGEVALNTVNPFGSFTANTSVGRNERSSLCKPAAKVIFTGHKSDQSPQEHPLQGDCTLKGSFALALESSQDYKALSEKSESRKALSNTFPIPSADSGMRFETAENRCTNPLPGTASQDVAYDFGVPLPLSTDFKKSTSREEHAGDSFLKSSFVSASESTYTNFHDLRGRDLRELKFTELCPSSIKEGGVKVTDHHDFLQNFGDVSSTYAPVETTPKKVRLFGANLVLGRVESPCKKMVATKLVDSNIQVPETRVVTAAVVAETTDFSGLPQGRQTGELGADYASQTEKAADKLESAQADTFELAEKMPTSRNLVEQQVTTTYAPAPQSLSVQASLLERQAASTAALLKNVVTPTRPLLLRQTGGRTWVRSENSVAAPVNSTVGTRSLTSGTGLISQPPRRGVESQKTAYVRKGNSLVRATGIATSAPPFPPASRVMQIRPPVATQAFTQKAPVPRNPFLLYQETKKSSQPVWRKTTESVVHYPSMNKSVTVPNSLLSNGEKISLSEPSSSLTRPKTPPPGNLKGPQNCPVSSASPAAIKSAKPKDHVTIREDHNSQVADSSGNFPVAKALPMGTLNGCVASYGGLTYMKYVRTKANQLVVAPCAANVDATQTDNPGAKKQPATDLYFKRKTNQLVRNGDVMGEGVFGRAPVSNPAPKESRVKANRGSVPQKKSRLGRGYSSWVWTLNGAAVSQGPTASGYGRRPTLLFPWKRHNVSTTSRSRKTRTVPEGKKGSLLSVMSERLRRMRPVQPVYTRSADGFSLRRSGVLSVGGGNLKWTKSLEKRAKLASEAATMAVVAAESRKRERKSAVQGVGKAKRTARKSTKGLADRIVWVGLTRYKMDASLKTLQRIPDAKANSEASISSGSTKAVPLLTPRRSIIGGTVYLKVGNGNQLVRDPKAASQALASEKVRWSLHHARSRAAKKQQFCQFYTRFGKCNKEDGKCIYIHDKDKVAVCTKFLKGTCADEQCLLTHKIIPERMPDCSFFLEGLCTNETCPYRHVNVNSNAPYCDGFLRGYCKDGDKCNKKHTYVCPTHAATGECPDRSTCKFHHPKKKGKSGTKRKRRYFCVSGLVSGEMSEGLRVSSTHSAPDDGIQVVEEPRDNEELADFISLGGNDEEDGDMNLSPEIHKQWSFSRPGIIPSFLPMDRATDSAQEIENWIKPTFLLKATNPAAS